MSDYFEIFGTLIKMNDIKDFRIVQKEYIYRPTYIENEKTLMNKITGKNLYLVVCNLMLR